MKVRILVLCLSIFIFGTTAVPLYAQSSAQGGNDPEIFALIETVDRNELAAAETAIKKQLNSQVIAYAKLLHKEHDLNLKTNVKLAQDLHIEPAETAAVQELQAKGKQTLDALTPLEGDQFSKTYLDAMIKGHTEVLDLIDRASQETRNDTIKKRLADMRQHVAMHLQKAQDIQGALFK